MPPSRSRSPAPRSEASRRRSRSPRRRSPRREDRYRDKDTGDRDRPRSPRLRSPRQDDSNRDRDRDRRDRSRDREERPRERKPKSSGFKWKEKRRDDDREEPKRLERGYRNRSPSPRRVAPKAEIRVGKGTSVEDKFGVAAKFGTSAVEKFGASVEDKFGPSKKDVDTSKPPQRAAAAVPAGAPPAQAPTGEPMIIVHVNDRLGTKAAIPCLASDPVRLFKAQVAARIGRQPHEIMLKRQGERPFKDLLTLEDYGVSNGVQLDLEIDTGD